MHNTFDNLTDEDLVLRVKSGGIEAFGFLVERYENKMKRYARKFLFGYADIEDTVQKVFIKAYVNIQSFDTSRKFSSWLYRIAHNEFINAIKKKKREPLSLFNPDVIFPHPISKDRPDDFFEQKETKEMVKRSLSKLKPKMREVIVLYYYENLSYKEIADILHIPVSTIGVRISRAKKILKQIYGK